MTDLKANKTSAVGVTRCGSSDAEHDPACSTPTTTTGSNEIIDVFKNLPKRLWPKKQLTTESDDEMGKPCNIGSKPSPFEPASRYLKPSGAAQNYKLNRRRSKTYSGEELAAQLERLNQIHQQELSNQNRKIFSLNSKLLNNLLSSGGGTTNTGSDSSIKTKSNSNNVTPSTLPPPVSFHFNIPIRSPSLQDQLLKRTNFDRSNYGLLELLFTLDREGIIQNIGKFRIENGESVKCLNTTNTIHLENPESQTRWYFKYFLGRVHQNYLIEDKNKTIFFLSVVITDANDRHIPQYKVILWTKNGSQKLTLPYQANKAVTVKQILSHFQIEADKSPKEILDPEIQRELLVLEEQEGSINFKFGIVYAKQGQLTDDEMLSNENGSPEFEKFLALVGDKIRLKGWKRYRGGLDTATDTTGEYSVYTIYEGHEIMFHVSTQLPYIKDSKQQLERKRHIGNDIVTIVFQDLEDNQEPDFTPSSARSQFQHIFALVIYNKKDNSYNEQSVPPFGPSLPTPPVFANHKEFREFLLVKLINGEKSAFNNSVFGKRRKRTIEAILTSLYNTYENKESVKSKTTSGSSGLGEAISDALTTANLGSKRKEELRKAEFLRIGQSLKLQTIIKGDAPTSQLTTGVVRKELWEPKIFLQSFEHSVTCSDSWNNCLVLGTNNGVFVVDEAIPWETKQLFDKSVHIRQLDVSEQYGIMMFIDFKGRMCVFHLSEFAQIMSDSSNWDQSTAKTKSECKEHRLDFINSCHTYAMNKQVVSANETLRVVAACGKKLLLFQLKSQPCTPQKMCSACAAGQTTTATTTTGTGSPVIATMNKSSSAHNIANVEYPGSGNSAVTGAGDASGLFQIVKEINCSDVPQIVNIMETHAGDTYILIAFKNRCEIIDERTGEYLRIFQFNPLSTIRSVVELYDNKQLEILVTHNYTSEFIRLDPNNFLPPVNAALTSSTATPATVTANTSTKLFAYYTFQWNCEPNHILCVFPYVIGFANQSIEIRLMVNGNLVNSITMSNIKLVASKKEIFFSADHELFMNNDLSMAERYLNSFVISVTNPASSSSSANTTSTQQTNLDENSPPSSPSAETATATAPSFFPNPLNAKSQQPQQQPAKPPCSIYKISLDFLNQTSQKSSENFRHQLCENSTRTIQREISNFSSQFLFGSDETETSKIYQKIISSNKELAEEPVSKVEEPVLNDQHLNEIAYQANKS